jgi:hypothetical protein
LFAPMLRLSRDGVHTTILELNIGRHNYSRSLVSTRFCFSSAMPHRGDGIANPSRLISFAACSSTWSCGPLTVEICLSEFPLPRKAAACSMRATSEQGPMSKSLIIHIFLSCHPSCLPVWRPMYFVEHLCIPVYKCCRRR